MLKAFLRAQLGKFEKAYGYDMSYGREILDADLSGFLKFFRAMAFTQHRRDVPPAVYHAAKLVSVMSEDCGPCTQLLVQMAEQDGVPAEVLRAVLARKPSLLPADAQLGYRFAEAALAHAPEADALREQIEARWGKRALVSLAYALAGARIYPTLKYALGHGKTCMRVTVSGQVQNVARAAA